MHCILYVKTNYFFKQITCCVLESKYFFDSKRKARCFYNGYVNLFFKGFMPDSICVLHLSLLISLPLTWQHFCAWIISEYLQIVFVFVFRDSHRSLKRKMSVFLYYSIFSDVVSGNFIFIDKLNSQWSFSCTKKSFSSIIFLICLAFLYFPLETFPCTICWCSPPVVPQGQCILKILSCVTTML